MDMYKVLEIGDNVLKVNEMTQDYILSNYELFRPNTSNCLVNLGNRKNLGYDKPYNNKFVSEYYNVECYGDCILFLDDEKEEYIIKLMR